MTLFMMSMVVSSSRGAVLFSETFDGAVAGSTKGGRFVETFGPGNFGWQGTADQSKVKRTDFIQYVVSDGVNYSSEKGTLEFWLKNDRPGGLEFGDKKVNYNTVFQWIRDDSTLVLYVLWRSDRHACPLRIVAKRQGREPECSGPLGEQIWAFQQSPWILQPSRPEGSPG
jgi:hypothetical protein